MGFEDSFSDDSRTDSESDSIFDEFIEQHCETEETWTRDKNKKQCPECSAVNDLQATECKVCAWEQSQKFPTIPPRGGV
jgi:ribosomal protein L40E